MFFARKALNERLYFFPKLLHFEIVVWTDDLFFEISCLTNLFLKVIYICYCTPPCIKSLFDDSCSQQILLPAWDWLRFLRFSLLDEIFASFVARSDRHFKETSSSLCNLGKALSHSVSQERVGFALIHQSFDHGQDVVWEDLEVKGFDENFIRAIIQLVK